MSSRAAVKGEARAARIAAEQQAQEAARRRGRLIKVGVIAAAAGLIVLALILASQAGKDSAGPVSGGPDAAAVFAGIPQQGNMLGDPRAPGTMAEYADLQCPFCAQYADGVLPGIVDRYVRTGRVRLELNLIPVIGPDSELAARAGVAAGRQNKMWQFAEVFYRNQGPENSGYADKAFIQDVARAVPGLDAAQLMRDMNNPGVAREASRMEARSQQLRVSGTPTFFVSRRGGAPQELSMPALELGSFTAPLDRLAPR
jgi:protein-disulfide isomerase